MMFKKIQGKIHDWQSLETTVRLWKEDEEKIVFTNGCFDILHFGHIQYLADAKDLGDKLVVGLNSGKSVSRLKGPGRPINDEATRLHLLASLEFVDAVVIFDQDTPLELISLLQPDILVKGGDWKPESIVGSELVLKKGGKVLSLPFVSGYSTTAIEQKIKSGSSE